MSRYWPLLIVGLCAGCGSATRPPEPTTPRQKREADLRDLGAVVRRAYAYVEEKRADAGVDFDRIVDEAIGRLDRVESDADFHDLLKEVIAGLKDGHCEVFAGHLAAPKPRSWPLLLGSVKEGVVVFTTHPALPPNSGVSRGDLVREANGRRIEDWVEEATRMVSASSDGSRRRSALRRMTATNDETVTLEVEHLDGTNATVTLKTVPWFGDTASTTFAAGRVLGDGIGYINIPSFAPPPSASGPVTSDAERDAALRPAREQIDAAFEAVAGTRALVLDLRSNGGGADLLGAYLLSHLVPGDFVYYSTQTRSSPDLRRVPGFGHLTTDGWAPRQEWRPRKTPFSFFEGEPYSGRLVVLINEGCFSTTDCVLRALADLRPGVRFVGRPAGGGAGGPTIVAKLPHCKADVQLNVMRVWGPKGKLIEGWGTHPDVPVALTRQDALGRRDPDLEAAVRDLQQAPVVEHRPAGAGIARPASLPDGDGGESSG